MYLSILRNWKKKGLRKLYEGQRVSYEIYDDRGRTAAGAIEIL